MKDLKHTPAPWTRESTNVMTEKRMIANCNGNGASVTIEDIANAKLIAAAPDLLRAATMLITELDKGRDLENNRFALRNAIKKATE